MTNKIILHRTKIRIITDSQWLIKLKWNNPLIIIKAILFFTGYNSAINMTQSNSLKTIIITHAIRTRLLKCTLVDQKASIAYTMVV